jgi:hypothetical protein
VILGRLLFTLKFFGMSPVEYAAPLLSMAWVSAPKPLNGLRERSCAAAVTQAQVAFIERIVRPGAIEPQRTPARPPRW